MGSHAPLTLVHRCAVFHDLTLRSLRRRLACAPLSQPPLLYSSRSGPCRPKTAARTRRTLRQSSQHSPCVPRGCAGPLVPCTRAHPRQRLHCLRTCSGTRVLSSGQMRSILGARNVVGRCAQLSATPRLLTSFCPAAPGRIMGSMLAAFDPLAPFSGGIGNEADAPLPRRHAADHGKLPQVPRRRTPRGFSGAAVPGGSTRCDCGIVRRCSGDRDAVVSAGEKLRAHAL